MTLWPSTLAQTAKVPTDALLWIGLIIVITVIGGFIVMMMRRRLLAPDESSADNVGLMDSLRAMRDRGELTQAEFDAARRSLIEKAMAKKQAQGAEPPPPSTLSRSIRKPPAGPT